MTDDRGTFRPKILPARWYIHETGEQFLVQIELGDGLFGVALIARDDGPPKAIIFLDPAYDYDLSEIDREKLTEWAEEAADPIGFMRRYGFDPEQS
jgi:hypothetical protein